MNTPKRILYAAAATEFSTTDLYLAAYLVAKGQPIARVAVADKPGRLAFVFAAEAKELADAWFTASVSAIQYVSSIRTLKQLAGARRAST